jgi:hypothetical protein
MLIGLYLGMDSKRLGKSAIGWGIVSLVMYIQAIICFLSDSPIVGVLDLSVGVYDTILMGNRLHDYNVKKFNEENKHKSKREQFLAEIMNNRK